MTFTLGTRNSTQHLVMTYMGNNSKNQWLYEYIQLIHFAVQQILTHFKATVFSQNFVLNSTKFLLAYILLKI